MKRTSVHGFSDCMGAFGFRALKYDLQGVSYERNASVVENSTFSETSYISVLKDWLT